MNIGAEALLNVYADTLAWIIVLGLLVFSVRTGIGKDPVARKLFIIICLSQMVNAFIDGVSCYFFYIGAGKGWPLPIRLIPATIEGFSMIITMFVWFLYVEHKLCKSRERTTGFARFFNVPVVIMGILLIVNLFTGFMFYVDEQMVQIKYAGFYVMVIMMYFYGLFPFIAVLRYTILHGKPRFFSIFPMLIPVLVSAPFSTFTPFSPAALGISIGTVFLYFSYINEWRFGDPDSGFFNKHYINYLLEIADQNNGKEYKNAIYFEADGPGEPLFQIFREDIPNGGELIRLSKNKFMIFSESSKLSLIRYLSDLIVEDADTHDKENPAQPKIGLKAGYLLREKGEPITDFIKRAGACTSPKLRQ